MATKKKPKPETLAPISPSVLPEAAQAYGSETFCSQCNGMVSFNGCAQDGCPVAKKAQ
jgi:hypothetical protein